MHRARQPGRTRTTVPPRPARSEQSLVHSGQWQSLPDRCSRNSWERFRGCVPASLRMKYWIDNKDRIAHVDETWLAFAAENGAPGLTPERVCGRPLSMFVDDRTTSYLWSYLLSRARRGPEVAVTIRCDAPTRRRT